MIKRRKIKEKNRGISMKLSYFFLAALCVVGICHAALPPLWEDIAELKAILNDEHLSSNLSAHLQSGEVILAIKKIDQGWMIVTNHHQLPIRIVPKPQEMPGPMQFDVIME